MKHYRLRNENTKKYHRLGKVVQSFEDKEVAKKKRLELNGVIQSKNKDQQAEKFATGWRVSPYEVLETL